ncbi:RICIN domain-containing protein [Streptomyces scopuliridis]|uniref:Ricin B lectin n=2 Tax=Streptomyces scopuliridis TaxID=452529 RepID=A0A2T7T9W4_9ACTN|nr:RICIN domain-containing protein [Streptomyces scopuliridis]PVE11881.1 ricin B lectin [Streptomyces scopuliridis RB72]WSB32471.1 RICIN domain-containing protein [Streptomyces scopuliridis]WSB96717.1 RICIN domain-containing protein [Streptomyces scopuliridis]WSC09579.1 RICIN domain-containing protein [Streptomyces scopuliridis]
MSAYKLNWAAAAAALVGTMLVASMTPTASAQPDTDRAVTVKKLSLRLASNPSQVANVKGGGSANGTPVIQWPWSGTPNERWEATAKGGGYYQFASLESGKCLNVKGGGNANGTEVIQWTCGNDANALWKFVPKGIGYELVVKSSQKCLNVRGGVGKGNALIQYTCTGVANDIWLPVWEH